MTVVVYIDIFYFSIFFSSSLSISGIAMAGSQSSGAQRFQTPVSVGRGRGFMGTPIPFPQLSASVGSTVGSAAHTPTPLVSDPPHTTRTREDSSPTRQPPCTSTPFSTEDSLGQMGGIVQHIGQQLADSILLHLNRPSPAAASSAPSVRGDSHTPAQDSVIISASCSESEESERSPYIQR